MVDDTAHSIIGDGQTRQSLRSGNEVKHRDNSKRVPALVTQVVVVL